MVALAGKSIFDGTGAIPASRNVSYLSDGEFHGSEDYGDLEDRFADEAF